VEGNIFYFALVKRDFNINTNIRLLFLPETHKYE
jgi:hypothetical protein